MEAHKLSTATLILGPSGSGKSTSLRNLDFKSTFIFGILDKPLPFRGYRKRYNEENKNYFVSDDYRVLLSYIKAVNERRPDISTFIIDDFQYLLSHEFMNRVSEKGYDKYSELAFHAWSVIKSLTETRDNLNCFVLTHSDADQHGNMKIKTIGRLLEDKIALEGMFTCCLYSMVKDGEYQFMTNTDGIHLSKSPIGLFDSQFIDNDLAIVIEKMNDYFNEDEE
jgi:hypothetical protein